MSLPAQSYCALWDTQARALVRLLKRQPKLDKRQASALGQLEAYLQRFEPARRLRENWIRRKAIKTLHQDSDLEIDHNAVISEGDDNGAYVLAWTWFSFDGTKFDKDPAPRRRKRKSKNV